MRRLAMIVLLLLLAACGTPNRPTQVLPTAHIVGGGVITVPTVTPMATGVPTIIPEPTKDQNMPYSRNDFAQVCPLRPVGGYLVLTQGFNGQYISPGSQPTHLPSDIWGAIDIAVDKDGDGKPEIEATQDASVVSPESGVVTMAEYSEYSGNVITIDSEARKYSFAHLGVITVAVGQTVSKGQEIGRAGNTGNRSGGAHLDFAIFTSDTGWQKVDPEPLFQEACGYSPARW